ncbi:MAG: HAD family hydrolase [Candidatus Delongbacteria bacterium]
MKKKAFFLDRDGTVNIDREYLYRTEDFEFESGVIKTLKYLYEKNYELIVITNQSGIARGYYTEDDLHKLHEHISKQALLHGFKFTDFYYCPHFKEGSVKKYSKECSCRKPGTGLFEKAFREHNINASLSYMAGDKRSDMIAGKNVGLTTILVGTGKGKETRKTFDGYDHYFENITGVMTII